MMGVIIGHVYLSSLYISHWV